MKKTIAVFTATRAEYGLLKTIIRALKADKSFKIKLIAASSHLSPEFGMTCREIEEDGIKIHKKIECLLSGDSPAAISKTMGLTLIALADYFVDNKPDAFMVLGDRYEALAAACAAFNAQIPIIHLYGGESTEGAIDEAYRHSITKMSYLHLVSTDEYLNRVIQLGENPERVFKVGAIGIENALNTKLLTKAKLSSSLGIKLEKDYAVGTFHPVTLEGDAALKQTKELLKAIENFPNIQFIFTKANSDPEGLKINLLLEEYASKHSNFFLFDSLGMERYLSAVKHSKFVVGNSSSGIIEVPSFKIPTINIGHRQKGRLMSSSVINCQPNYKDISSAIKKAMGKSFREIASKAINPMGDGETSSKIVGIIKASLNLPINLKKAFFNLPI